MGSLAVWMWAENYYIPYFLAVYVAGEIVCLTATFVWEGPANQCKKVLQRDVLCAFLLYVLSLAGLVAVAFMVPKRSSPPLPLRPCPQVPQDSDWVRNKSYEVRRCAGVCPSLIVPVSRRWSSWRWCSRRQLLYGMLNRPSCRIAFEIHC